MTGTGRRSRFLVLGTIGMCCSVTTLHAALWYLYSWHPDSLKDAQATIGLGFIGGAGWVVGVLPMLLANHMLSKRPAMGRRMVVVSLAYAGIWVVASWIAGASRLGLLQFIWWLLLFPPLSLLFTWMAPFAPSNFRYALAVLPLLVAFGIIDLWVMTQRKA